MTVPVLDAKHAETLRTGLLRKLRGYKKLWDDTGYLSAEMENSSLSFILDEDGEIATIKLKARTHRTYSYKLLALLPHETPKDF